MEGDQSARRLKVLYLLPKHWAKKKRKKIVGKRDKLTVPHLLKKPSSMGRQYAFSYKRKIAKRKGTKSRILNEKKQALRKDEEIVQNSTGGRRIRDSDCEDL